MTRYHIRIPDLTVARGDNAHFAWDGQSPQHLAGTVEQVLREPAFAERWRGAQPDPELVDASLLNIDAGANVCSANQAQQVNLVVTTNLPHRILAHRLNLLIGAHWTLRDVR